MIICIEVNIESATNNESSVELTDDEREPVYQSTDAIEAIRQGIEDAVFGTEVEVEIGDEAFTLVLDCGTPWVQEEETP